MWKFSFNDYWKRSMSGVECHEMSRNIMSIIIQDAVIANPSIIGCAVIHDQKNCFSSVLCTSRQITPSKFESTLKT